MRKLNIKNTKLVIVLYWIGIIINSIHIYIRITKEENVLIYVITILMSLFLLKTLSLYQNNIINLCSVFILYGSVMGLIDAIFPWRFWTGFIVFIPLLAGIIILLYMLINQKQKKYNKLMILSEATQIYSSVHQFSFYTILEDWL